MGTITLEGSQRGRTNSAVTECLRCYLSIKVTNNVREKKECVENFQNGNKPVSNNLFFRSHAEHLTSLELGEFSVGD